MAADGSTSPTRLRRNRHSNGLLDSRTERKILSLCAGEGHSSLQLGLPADRSVAKGEDISRLRLARRGILTPARIHIATYHASITVCTRRECQTPCTRSLEITQNVQWYKVGSGSDWKRATCDTAKAMSVWTCPHSHIQRPHQRAVGRLRRQRLLVRTAQPCVVAVLPPACSLAYQNVPMSSMTAS